MTACTTRGEVEEGHDHRRASDNAPKSPEELTKQIEQLVVEHVAQRRRAVRDAVERGVGGASSSNRVGKSSTDAEETRVLWRLVLVVDDAPSRLPSRWFNDVPADDRAGSAAAPRA